MEDRESKKTGHVNPEEKATKENRKKEERVETMLIGAIYDKVFVPMSGESGSADEAMNEKILLLMAGADMEHMDKLQLTDLLCRSAVIGQREGFISGVRFAARLLCNMLS